MSTRVLGSGPTPPGTDRSGLTTLDDESGAVDSADRIVLADECSEPAVVAPPSSGAWDEVLTATGMVMGTPAYMAPEQFLDERADGRAAGDDRPPPPVAGA